MTTQPSPDLPDSLRRDRKPATAAGEDLYREAIAAWRTEDPATFYDETSPWLRAAVDRVAELTEQRVRAEMAAWTEARDRNDQDIANMLSIGGWPVGAMFHRVRTERDQVRADLAAMTARAESAEAMYDQARPPNGAAGITDSLPPGVDPVAYLEKRLSFAWAEIDQLGQAALRLRGQLDDAEHRIAELEAARPDRTGPLSAPSARVAAEQAAAEGQRTAEGVAGDAA
jgi:hypothetical protein